MSDRAPPPWLAELQARFGEVLRTPLDRAGGRVRASTEAYDPTAVAEVRDRAAARAADRLAVYNRQYWFRLLRTMQTAFPLTARLLGPWELDGLAARFLGAHPPRGWDLETVPIGFERFVEEALAVRADAPLLCEAVKLDAAWAKVSRAPAVVPFRPRPQDAAQLLDARLVLSPAAAIFVEGWALSELRAELSDTSRRDSASPDRLSAPRWSALVCDADGIRRFALESREGELLSLLTRHSVRDALAHLEDGCTPGERAQLPERTRRWLTRSVALGLWSEAKR